MTDLLVQKSFLGTLSQGFSRESEGRSHENVRRNGIMKSLNANKCPGTFDLQESINGSPGGILKCPVSHQTKITGISEFAFDSDGQAFVR